MALLCSRVLAPPSLAIWALIFAVTLYPCTCAWRPISADDQGSQPTLLVLLGVIVLIVPSVTRC